MVLRPMTLGPIVEFKLVNTVPGQPAPGFFVDCRVPTLDEFGLFP